MGKEWSLEQIVLGQLDVHTEKKMLNLFLTSYTKISSKWNINLHVRDKKNKILQANFYDIRLVKTFIDKLYKSTSDKSKENTSLHFNKIKIVCASKYIKKMKTQTTDGRKYLV
jgi:hypothetical protein